ncbi:hypothetical protein [Qipengyuania flava]|uniref:hypothetical protein n=1 Tax=Qipengyuania flava TaxID=192812 RepID=UPI001CFCD820|nr:hypothetical protein [Qipengyuania flava]
MGRARGMARGGVWYGEPAEAREEAALPPPERGEEEVVDEAIEEPPDESGPRLWSLKDDGWR